MNTYLKCLPLVMLTLIAAAAPSSSEVALRAARSFPDGGGYNLKWTGSGTPEEILFSGQRVLAKGTDGTYCSGFTFAVAMKAANHLGLLESKSFEQIKRFQKEWYGAADDPDTREKQCSVAVANLGTGQSILPVDARPGDFMQFWRNNKSGHSVIFLDWIMEEGHPVGFKYRSSQGTTQGIGDNVERFAEHGGKVDPKRLYFGRLNENSEQRGRS